MKKEEEIKLHKETVDLLKGLEEVAREEHPNSVYHKKLANAIQSLEELIKELEEDKE